MQLPPHSNPYNTLGSRPAPSFSVFQLLNTVKECYYFSRCSDLHRPVAPMVADYLAQVLVDKLAQVLVYQLAVLSVHVALVRVLHLAMVLVHKQLMVLVLALLRATVLQSTRNHLYFRSELDQLDTDSIPVCA